MLRAQRVRSDTSAMNLLTQCLIGWQAHLASVDTEPGLDHVPASARALSLTGVPPLRVINYRIMSTDVSKDDYLIGYLESHTKVFRYSEFPYIREPLHFV